MEKLRNIEFLRIIFAISVVYYHMFGNMKKFCASITDSSFIQTLGQLSYNRVDAYILVEGFVMIAGFFLFYTIKNKGEIPWGKFALDKLMRLFPVVGFTILITVIFSLFGVIKINFYTQFLNLITLQSIGVNLEYKGINWFISPFFWSMLFIFGMYKAFPKKVFHFTLAILVYFCYVILVMQPDFNVRHTIGLCLNLGMVRMVASLGLGYFIGMFYDNVKDLKMFQTHKLKTFILFSIAEITTFVIIINWTLFHQISYKNKFIFIPVFAILIFSFVMNKGLLSKLTNTKLFETLGKYSYSIYVMQQVSFWLLGLFLWNQTNFLHNHLVLVIILSLLFSSLLGMVAYYLVEQPVAKWYKSLKY